MSIKVRKEGSINHLVRFYYQLKPLLPRSLQIWLRQYRAKRLRSIHSNVWPIDKQASIKPRDWNTWPDEKQFALVLTHDVETALGCARCLDLMQIEKSLGFRSAFYFLAEAYSVPRTLRETLSDNGFEIGLHGLNHDVSPFYSKRKFRNKTKRINRYIQAWDVAGFRAPSMHSNLQWMHDLDIEYDASTFDVDPFEPQPDGMRTIFPFWVSGGNNDTGYVELPYTLPQDFTLFVILREQSIDLWKLKLDWLADNGGMALIITHPDYMGFRESRRRREEYPVVYYRQFLEYVKNRYCDKYWHALPREMAAFWKTRYSKVWQGNSKGALNATPRRLHGDTSAFLKETAAGNRS